MPKQKHDIGVMKRRKRDTLAQSRRDQANASRAGKRRSTRREDNDDE